MSIYDSSLLRVHLWRVYGFKKDVTPMYRGGITLLGIKGESLVNRMVLIKHKPLTPRRPVDVPYKKMFHKNS